MWKIMHQSIWNLNNLLGNSQAFDHHLWGGNLNLAYVGLGIWTGTVKSLQQNECVLSFYHMQGKIT